MAIRAAEEIAVKLHPGPLAGPPTEAAPDSPTFRDYSQRWHAENSKRWGFNTVERYSQILRLHLWPHPLFQRPLGQIGRRDLKRFLKELFCQVSSASVESVHGVISGVFEEAIDDELLGANPAHGILKKILPPKRMRDEKDPAPFTREELGGFLAAAEGIGTPTELMVLKAMAYGGFRLGEALAMRLRNLDSERMRYTVSESFRQYRFQKPKFSKPRIVDLPRFFVDDLTRYIAWLRKEGLKAGRGGQIDLLFVDPAEKGTWPYSQRKIQYLMKRVCKAVRLETRNPHDLRHTYATLLLMAHQSPGYVQKQLGHSSISITMVIYCHCVPGEGRAGLEAALPGGAGGRPAVRHMQIFAYKKGATSVTD